MDAVLRQVYTHANLFSIGKTNYFFSLKWNIFSLCLILQILSEILSSMCNYWFINNLHQGSDGFEFCNLFHHCIFFNRLVYLFYIINFFRSILNLASQKTSSRWYVLASIMLFIKWIASTSLIKHDRFETKVSRLRWSIAKRSQELYHNYHLDTDNIIA